MDTRKTAILDILNIQDEVTVRELADRFGVTDMTIRRDFDELQKQGLLTRTHGGAVSSAKLRFLQLGRQNGMPSKAKAEIGKRAATLVQPGQTIMIDTGTTALEVSRHLPQGRDITVVTTSLLVAQELFETDINVLLLGGFVRKTFPSVYGPATEQFLSNIHINTLFIGCDGAHSNDGFYSNDLHVSSLDRVSIRIADQSVVVTESEKFGKKAFAKYAAISDVNTLVTDSGLSQADKQNLEDNGVTVLTCEVS